MAEDQADKVWKMMKRITLCMLASRDGEEIRARPMAAYVRPEENRVYFLTDVEAHKDEEIARAPNVNLAFADTSSHAWVAVTGRAEVSNDREKIAELFDMPAKAWWDSADDPSIRLLTVTPNDAQYWDSPGRIVSTVKMAAAAIGGGRPDMGDNAKVEMGERV